MSYFIVRPFTVVGDTENMAVAATTASVAVTRSGMGLQALRLVNAGTQTVFIALGTSTVTATTTASMPLVAGAVEIIALPKEVTHVAAIAGATGSTLYITTGEGI